MGCCSGCKKGGCPRNICCGRCPDRERCPYTPCSACINRANFTEEKTEVSEEAEANH